MNYGTKNEAWIMCLIPPHINTVSYPTTTPPLKFPQTKESRSLFRGEHHQQNNLTNLNIYQPENKNGYLLIKIVSISNHETMN